MAAPRPMAALAAVLLLAMAQGCAGFRGSMAAAAGHRTAYVRVGLRAAKSAMGGRGGDVKECGRRRFLQTALVNAGVSLAGLATKRRFFRDIVCAVAPFDSAEQASAEQGSASEGKKLVGISDEQFKKMLHDDVVNNQFMVTGALTRSLYDEKCTFTDEIDTYTLDKWMDGTAKLFKNDYSSAV
eukprot:767219-Hanusia_phi.AAC.1